MVLSKTTGYGIRALAYLAAQPGKRRSSLHEIAQHEGIPEVYLQKILGELRRHRFLRATKGIHGGYELNRSPQSITLWDVFCVLEPDPYLDTCILGYGRCSPQHGCVLHREWCRIRDEIVRFLQTTTVSRVSLESRTDRQDSSHRST
jgi:Rrf2 family protein